MSDKKPLESKKFTAFLISSILWVTVMITALVTMRDVAGFSSTLLAMALCLGFVQALYIGGQSAVDTFVRIAVAFAPAKASKPTPQISPPKSDPRPVLGPDSL